MGAIVVVEIDMALIPEANRAYLNYKQRVDYRNHRQKFIDWLLVFGKNPKAVEGFFTYACEMTKYFHPIHTLISQMNSFNGLERKGIL